MNDNQEMFAGYFPVIHDGYIKAIGRHPDATIGIFDNEIISEHAPYLRKDIRTMSPENIQLALEGLGRKSVILGRVALEKALENPIIMPNDDITRAIEHIYPSAQITKESTFLRWDRDNSDEKSAIIPDRIITADNISQDVINLLNKEASTSSNWWRHVGSVIFDENSIQLSAHNSSMPTEYSTCIDCDPRITAKKGESIERSIDIHSEAKIIAEASKHGISLEGKNICVSTFPCPNCAKLIALSGVKSCYYVEGYAMLDGYNILKDYGVEIVHLDIKMEPEDPNSLKPYPESK